MIERIRAGALALSLMLATGGSAFAQQDGAPTPPAAPQAPASVETAPAQPAEPVQQTPAPAATVPPAGAPAAPQPAAPQPTAPVETPSATAPAGAVSPPSAPAPVATPLEPVAEQNPALPHDLSPWGMFMAADWVVKGVMIGLAFASLVTWTIWLAKALELRLATRRAKRGVRQIEAAPELASLEAGGSGALRRGPVAAILKTAQDELARSGGLPADGVKERVAIAVARIEARAGRTMTKGTGVLATIGATAPFVGLFGTVWGIMNSFIGISQANTTNLAVVAPGIAEALLATAIGLVAAIPAVIIYNSFARSTAGYRALLADGSAAVMQHLSRGLDRRDAAGSPNRFHAAAE